MAEDFGDANFIKNGAVLLCGEEARDDGIDPDIAVGPFAGEITSEVMDGGLRGGVGEDAGERINPGDGAEINNRGLDIAAHEVVSEDLAGAHDADEINIKNAEGFFIGNFDERGGRVHAGAIDEDVDLTGLLDDGIEEFIERVPVTGIGTGEVAVSASGADGFEAGIGLRFVTPDEDDFGTGLGEAEGHVRTEFPGAADDDSSLSFKAKESVKIVCATHFGGSLGKERETARKDPKWGDLR